MSLPSKAQLKEIWSEVPADYYYHLNLFQKLWHEWKWLVFRHLLTTRKTSPKRILEVGCAGGHLTGLLHQLYPKAAAVGIDVYAPAIQEAKKRHPAITFTVADAHKLPFKDDFFDIVVSSETIEHVVDPTKMLNEIKRVMSKNGVALIEMDSGNWLFRIIWFFWTRFGKGKVWGRAHLHPFHQAELEAVIKECNFIIDEKIVSHFGMAVTFLLKK